MTKKGQAATELAIFGAIAITLLGYLLSTGYLYNQRQSLEMYAFRKALDMSRAQERGITLSVIRDVISPSFFTSLNRQRTMAFASVEYNPYKLYVPENPDDTSYMQYMQIGEGMIQQGSLIRVPPTKVSLNNETRWTSSAVSELDARSVTTALTHKTAVYGSNVVAQEDAQARAKTVDRTLTSHDTVPFVITFETADRVAENYEADDWRNEVNSITVDATKIPQSINLILDETVERRKNLQTPY